MDELISFWTQHLSAAYIPTSQQWWAWCSKFSIDEIAYAFRATARKYERGDLYVLEDDRIEEAMVRYASGVMHRQRIPTVEPNIHGR